MILLLGALSCSTHESKKSVQPAAKEVAQKAQAAAVNKSDSEALQGTWKGQELGGDAEGDCYLIVSGKDFEFRGPDTNEWYKGTFTLREDAKPKQLLGSVTECCAPQYVGKMSHAIYRIEGDKLTLTAKAPGDPELPSGFDDNEARRFVFKAKQAQ